MPGKSKLNSFTAALFLPILLILLNGCVTVFNPVTKKNESVLLDTNGEVALGQDMDKQIRNNFKILNDSLLKQRLDYIGNKVASFSDRQDLVYHFSVIQDNELNAFSIPGGFIYVNSGLIDMSTDNELACVLGHEIGHIAARHSVKKLQASLGYQIITNIALGISGKEKMAKAMDIVFNITSLGYSRNDELLSDKLAVRYAQKAGFNPYGMITFFQKLKNEEEKKGRNFNLVFLSSHPSIEVRVKNAQNEIALNP